MKSNKKIKETIGGKSFKDLKVDREITIRIEARICDLWAELKRDLLICRLIGQITNNILIR